MACFKLRGIHATRTVQNVLFLHKNDAARQHDDNSLLLNDNRLHIHLPHGTPVVITVHVGDITQAIEGGTTLIGNRQVLLVAHCEATDSNRNEPNLGWDLYCDALISRDLFVALVVQGQACPIGVVEEAFTKLDCEPPIADIFPRDYPETLQGRTYWGLIGSHKDTDDDATIKDAAMLRLCLEVGERGGRIDVPTIQARSLKGPSPVIERKNLRLSSQSLCKLRWYDLITATGGGTSSEDEEKVDTKNNEHADDRVVMMRRSFCKPVYDAIAGSGKFVAAADVDQQRKRRRKAKESSWICHVIPLNRTEAESHKLSCTALLHSMSLPALIACQLKVLGKGTLKPGAQIHGGSEATDSLPLGYVTAASFSATRGCSHGTGVVGASLLLRTVIGSISTPQQAFSSLAVLDIQGLRRIELIVRVQNGPATMKATLALLG
jgi:hypothetical protein